MTRKKPCHSKVIDHLRRVISNIQVAIGNGQKSILITSAVAGEGKTFVACNLAAMLADGGRDTLLIDFNQHNPGVHAYFDLSNTNGISDYLTRDVPYSTAITPGQNRLCLMTAGSWRVNFNTLLDSARCRELLADAKEEYDYIIIDTPAINEAADGLILARYVDTSIFVVQAGRPDLKETIQSKEALARVNPHILGVIVNKAG